VARGCIVLCLFDPVLEAILQKVNITSHIGTKSTQILVYAYDVEIISRSKNELKDTLFNTEKEARRRSLLDNDNKTKYMQVARAVLNDEHLCCGNYKFEHVQEFSYLCSQMNQNNSISSKIQAQWKWMLLRIWEMNEIKNIKLKLRV